MAAPTPVKSGLVRTETRDGGHRYTLDGVPCPGVTTLISQGIPKPNLLRWAARVVAETVADMHPDDLDKLRLGPRDAMVAQLKQVPFRQRDVAAVRGKEVHAYAEQLIKGADVDVPERLAGYVASAVQFMNEWRPAPVLVEASVGSRAHRYCGTVDLICDLPDGRRALMDYKTSMSGIYPETAVQLAAYRHAEFAVDGTGAEIPLAHLGINCTYAVWVREDSYDVIPVRSDRLVFEFFLNAAHTGRRLDGMKEWVGAPESWKAAA